MGKLERIENPYVINERLTELLQANLPDGGRRSQHALGFDVIAYGAALWWCVRYMSIHYGAKSAIPIPELYMV